MIWFYFSITDPAPIILANWTSHMITATSFLNLKWANWTKFEFFLILTHHMFLTTLRIAIPLIFTFKTNQIVTVLTFIFFIRYYFFEALLTKFSFGWLTFLWFAFIYIFFICKNKTIFIENFLKLFTVCFLTTAIL